MPEPPLSARLEPAALADEALWIFFFSPEEYSHWRCAFRRTSLQCGLVEGRGIIAKVAALCPDCNRSLPPLYAHRRRLSPRVVAVMYPRVCAEQAVCAVVECCRHFYIWSEQGPYPNSRIGEPIFTFSSHHRPPSVSRHARLPGVGALSSTLAGVAVLRFSRCSMLQIERSTRLCIQD